MNYPELANDGVLEQPVYEPGKPIEDVAREFGLKPSEIAKLASNENPLGPSPMALDAVRSSLENAHLYPDGSCLKLRQRLSGLHDLSPKNLIVGNGSNEVIELLGHAFLRPGLEVVMGSQAFIVYKLVSKLFGATPVEVPMSNFGHDLDAMRAAVTERTRMVFVASPNNPTGIANTAEDLIAFAESLPESVIFCLDEAYAEYLAKPADLRPLIRRGKNIVCLRTFSKIYGLGALRIGYGYGPDALISILNRVRQPFNVNALAQAAALGALGDSEFLEKCFVANEEGRKQLVTGLKQLGREVIAGSANFVMANVSNGSACFEALQRLGVIVRPLKPYGLSEYIRITIGTSEENQRVLALLSAFFAEEASTL